MRCRLLAGVGLGCAGLMMVGMVSPTPASANYGRGPDSGCSAPQERQCDSGGASRGGTRGGGSMGGGSMDGGSMGRSDVAADCEQAAMDTPRGPAGLNIATDVREGAEVAPGQDIGIKITWDPKAWSGPDLDAALACVRVKGGLDPDLSNGERPSANDGAFEYVLHVPENIKPGCDICVQGFLTGIGVDGDPQQVTGDRACFMSGPPRPPTPPVTRPPATPATGPTTTTTVAPRTPTEVGGVQAGRPATTLTPAPASAGPAVSPAAELPRTGSPLTDLALAGGGLSLTLGGLSVMGGARRRRPGRRS